MAANGISTLPTKEDRQIAKLDLAQTKRQLVGTQGYRENRYYDLDLLPTKYSGDSVVNNPNVGGLVKGRPWKTTPNVLSGLWRSQYNGYFDGDWTWFDTQTPTASIQVNDFTFPDGGDSYQWLGYFKAPHTANYTFYLESDDRAQFWLGDNAITGYNDSNWDVYSDAGEGESSTDPISLTAGQYYPIRLQYGDAGGTSTLNFSWSDDYVGAFPTYEVVNPAGAIINTEQTAAFKLTIKSTSYNVEPFENAQIGINDLLTVDTSTRGHTVLRMEPDGTVISQTTFDTWGTPIDLDSMNAALLGYATGTVIAICTYDACGLNTAIRNTLNTYYGGTLTDTWGPDRYSHIFIGQKV
jgi:hypothetical protein